MKEITRSLALLAAIASGAAIAAGDNYEERNATVIDTGLAYLSNQLFQMAYSEHDTLETRTFLETRFIPQKIAAYFLKEASGDNIKIVATYRHGERSLMKDDAQRQCQAMINWVRFHLGVKDDGTLIAYASEFDTSTLYQFVRAAESMPDRNWARSLDSQTVIVGTVVPIVSVASGTATCRQPLVKR